MRTIYGLGILLLFSSSAFAQYIANAKAGMVEFIVGNVYVDGHPAAVTEVKFAQLKDGKVLHTRRHRKTQISIWKFRIGSERNKPAELTKAASIAAQAGGAKK